MEYSTTFMASAGDAQDAIAKGATPREVERAYKRHKVREVRDIYQITQVELKALALRWGIIG